MKKKKLAKVDAVTNLWRVDGRFFCADITDLVHGYVTEIYWGHGEADYRGICETYGCEPELPYQSWSGLHMGVIHSETGNTRSLVFLKEFRRFDEVDIGILSHELLHATCAVYRDRGIRAGCENDEPLCYLHQYLLTRAMLAVQRTRDRVVFTAKAVERVED